MKYKQVTITFDDKRLSHVFVTSREGVGVFERILQDPIQQAPRRILNNAFDAIMELIRLAVWENADKDTIWLLLNDLYVIKIALGVIIRGHRVIDITLDEEV